jgi:hypothetical protein
MIVNPLCLPVTFEDVLHLVPPEIRETYGLQA